MNASKGNRKMRWIFFFLSLAVAHPPALYRLSLFFLLLLYLFFCLCAILISTTHSMLSIWITELRFILDFHSKYYFINIFFFVLMPLPKWFVRYDKCRWHQSCSDWCDTVFEISIQLVSKFSQYFRFQSPHIWFVSYFRYYYDVYDYYYCYSNISEATCREWMEAS